MKKMVECGMQHFHDKNVFFFLIFLWSIFPKNPIHNDNALSLVKLILEDVASHKLK